MQRLTRRDLRSPEAYQETLERIGKLAAGTRPQWGTMTAAQMLAHCAEVQEVTNGSTELKGTPLPARLFKGMIRKMVLNDRPYPHNTRTHPQYLQTDERDFDAEKARLLAALDYFVKADDATLERAEHSLFGKMTAAEKGWAMYKHLDHHLAQFGL